jgi:hypothetical protein
MPTVPGEFLMEDNESLSDVEYLYKLRIDYLQAVQLEDYSRINSVIVPRFWERFAKYYEEYVKTWKHLSLSRLPIQVVIDPGQQREKQLDWIEHVLKGQIDLVA